MERLEHIMIPLGHQACAQGLRHVFVFRCADVAHGRDVLIRLITKGEKGHEDLKSLTF
jgi:hypothetical protein